MLSGKLIHLIESHEEEITARIVRSIRHHPELAHLGKLPEPELRILITARPIRLEAQAPPTAQPRVFLMWVAAWISKRRSFRSRSAWKCASSMRAFPTWGCPGWTCITTSSPEAA